MFSKLIGSLLIALLLIPSLCYAGVEFDGIDDFVGMGTMGSVGSQMDTQSLVFSCWVKSSTTDAVMAVMGTFNTGYVTGLVVQLNADGAGTLAAGNIRVYSRDEDTQQRAGGIESDTGITDGSWHHLVVEFHINLSHEVWIDGIKQTFVDNLTDPPDNMANFGFEMYIGAYNNRGTVGQTLGGQITEVAFWQNTTGGTLTQQEINNLAFADIKGMPYQIDITKEVSYLPLNDEPDGTSGDGNTFVDRVGSNNGTGDNGANNTGLTAKGEEILSYPPPVMGN